MYVMYTYICKYITLCLDYIDCMYVGTYIQESPTCLALGCVIVTILCLSHITVVYFLCHVL